MKHLHLDLDYLLPPHVLMWLLPLLRAKSCCDKLFKKKKKISYVQSASSKKNRRLLGYLCFSSLIQFITSSSFVVFFSFCLQLTVIPQLQPSLNLQQFSLLFLITTSKAKRETQLTVFLLWSIFVGVFIHFGSFRYTDYAPRHTLHKESIFVTSSQ